MERKDLIIKDYLSNSKHFTELFNSYIFNGKNSVKEDELKDLDAEIIPGDNLYDAVKVLKKDSHNIYCIISINEQTDINKFMPIRCLKYDNTSFSFIPVITIVIYWSCNKWNARKSIYELFEINPGVFKYISSYKINLIEPYSMTDEDINMMSDDFKHLFKIVKYLNDRNKLLEELKDVFYRNLSADTAEITNVLMDKS